MVEKFLKRNEAYCYHSSGLVPIEIVHQDIVDLRYVQLGQLTQKLPVQLMVPQLGIENFEGDRDAPRTISERKLLFPNERLAGA